MTPTIHSDFLLTPEVLQKIGNFAPKLRRGVLKAIGEIEWERCAKDPMYWLDRKKHPAMAYAYTSEKHPMYKCRLCEDDVQHILHIFNKLEIHLSGFHGVKVNDAYEARAHFEELPGTRAFTVMDYMVPIVDVWLRQQVVLIPKSRDMLATWTAVALYGWDTFFHSNRQNIIQSEDAVKTLELVQRAYFMWKHQPRFLKKHKAEFGSGSTRSGVLRLPEIDSEILGFPQGADQIRQYHPTGVFTDESAFHISAGDGFMAIKPAVQNGGRYTGVSSVNPGWFMLACQDRLDEAAL